MVNPITTALRFFTFRTNYELSRHERRVAKDLQKAVSQFPELESAFDKAEQEGDAEECKKALLEVIGLLAEEEEDLAEIAEGEQIIQKRAIETYQKEEHEVEAIKKKIKESLFKYEHIQPMIKAEIDKKIGNTCQKIESQSTKVTKEMDKVVSVVEGIVSEERRELIHAFKDREGMLRYITALRGGEEGISHHIFNLLRQERRDEKSIRTDISELDEDEDKIKKITALLEHEAEGKVSDPQKFAARVTELMKEEASSLEELEKVVDKYNEEFKQEEERIKAIIHFDVILHFHLLQRVQRLLEHMKKLGEEGFPPQQLEFIKQKEQLLQKKIDESSMIAFRGATFVKAAA